ncbi:hypothetical protein [Deinococcus peraridilitoris]|uniref:Uncharacterized protein n=1 Tax=Deinococcus peraridilitoris (strain DSM 19664 / LMG 22246 / CIP 109416 / KR-200) TaxID=937777 RepID=K9ZXN3_DEIPD|nr:hypothetical protein [Deinococcus peraridilitoris]AFZ65959.1 hypothetical protein Deipe_0359 [Deinococcus peraridilitoris DSM 19664]
MTKVFVLIVAEVALLLLLPAALFAWLGRRSPYFAALAKRYNRLVNVLLVGLVVLLLGWPLLQLVWPR